MASDRRAFTLAKGETLVSQYFWYILKVSPGLVFEYAGWRKTFMAEASGGERTPPGQSTEGKTRQGEQGGPRPDNKSNALLRQGSVFDKLRQIPPTEEPAFWPNRVMGELEFRIDPGEHPDSPFARQWAPLRQSLHVNRLGTGTPDRRAIGPPSRASGHDLVLRR